MAKSNLIIFALFSTSLVVGAAEVYLNSTGNFLTEQTQTLWGFIFVILSIMWATEDAKTQSFDKPFDFGFLMYIFWPIAFPYYLIATRKLDGLIYFSGFLAIWSGPWLAGLIAYVYLYS